MMSLYMSAVPMEVGREHLVPWVWSYRQFLSATWVLGTELRFSARAASALNHGATLHPWSVRQRDVTPENSQSNVAFQVGSSFLLVADCSSLNSGALYPCRWTPRWDAAPPTTKHCVPSSPQLPSCIFTTGSTRCWPTMSIKISVTSVLSDMSIWLNIFFERFSPLDPNALECRDSKPNIEFARVDLNSIR